MPIIGSVTMLDHHQTRGWALDTDSRAPVAVDVFIDDVKVRTLRPCQPRIAYRNAVQGGLVGFKFRFDTSLLRYVGRNRQRLVFRVAGETLPIERTAIRGHLVPAPLDELRACLADGYEVTKKGELKKGIHLDIEWQGRVLALYDRSRDRFSKLFGYNLFVAYGTLLGLERHGGFIPGDDDVDVSYLSRHDNAHDVGREMVSIASTLIAAGENVVIHPKRILLKWTVADGTSIDIFPSWVQRRHFYMTFAVAAPIDDAIAEGFEPRLFAGHPVLAPRAARRVLEATYGPNWLTPDPAFQWSVTPEVDAVMRQARPTQAELAEAYWTKKYRDAAANAKPSTFADHVAERWVEPGIRAVIDLACGDGRDTDRVAGALPGLGIDYSATGVESNRRRWQERPNLSFERGDVRDLAGMLAASAGLIAAADGPVLLYSRFFIHAIDDEAEVELRRYLAQALPAGSIVALEFRTHLDATEKKVFDDHFRRFVDPDDFVARMMADGGWTLLHHEAGQGLAPYRDEDPHVARLVFRRAEPA